MGVFEIDKDSGAIMSEEVDTTKRTVKKTKKKTRIQVSVDTDENQYGTNYQPDDEVR